MYYPQIYIFTTTCPRKSFAERSKLSHNTLIHQTACRHDFVSSKATKKRQLFVMHLYFKTGPPSSQERNFDIRIMTILYCAPLYSHARCSFSVWARLQKSEITHWRSSPWAVSQHNIRISCATIMPKVGWPIMITILWSCSQRERWALCTKKTWSFLQAGLPNSFDIFRSFFLSTILRVFSSLQVCCVYGIVMCTRVYGRHEGAGAASLKQHSNLKRSIIAPPSSRSLSSSSLQSILVFRNMCSHLSKPS